MLQKETLRYLQLLKKNNDRAWFEKNREKYDAARTDFAGLVDDLILDFSKKDSAYTGLTSKECVFRIYRDVRFSKNKAPYKDNFGATMKPGGKKSQLCGAYLQIGPSAEWGNFLAGGFWMPEAPVLKAIRQEIEYNTDEFNAILNDKPFKKWFGTLEDQKLSRYSKGVDASHPAAELMKYTSFIVTHEFSDEDVLSKSFRKKCNDAFDAMKPFLDFLNRSFH